MEKVKKTITALLFTVGILAVSAQNKVGFSFKPYPKSDQATIANYTITTEKVNQYMLYQKAVFAAYTPDTKPAPLQTNTIDALINQANTTPSVLKCVKSSGSNTRDLILTGLSLGILTQATDTKQQVPFKWSCDHGYCQMPSAEQIAFAKAHSADMVKWQKQIHEYAEKAMVHS